MGEIINGYKLQGALTTHNSGSARWGFADKGGKVFFIKEFLEPVYPVDPSKFSERHYAAKIKGCQKYEEERRTLYDQINRYADGNVVCVEDFFRYGGKYYITMEKISALPMGEKELAALPLDKKMILCMTLTHSLMQLHENGVVHADMKWTNFLFTKSSNGEGIVGKLIDFDNGFMENNPPTDFAAFNVDQVYCAPETLLFLNEEPVELTAKIDIFALGIILHQILTGSMPFFGHDYSYLCEAVLDDVRVLLGSGLSLNMKELIASMLLENPEDRPTAKQVFEILTSMVDWVDQNAALAVSGKTELAVSEKTELADPEPAEKQVVNGLKIRIAQRRPEEYAKLKEATTVEDAWESGLFELPQL